MVSGVRSGGRMTPPGIGARRTSTASPVSSAETIVRTSQTGASEKVTAVDPEERREGGQSPRQDHPHSRLSSESELMARSGFTATPAKPLEMLSCVLSLVTGGGRILFRNVEEALSLSPQPQGDTEAALGKPASERTKLALRALNGYKNHSEDGKTDVDVRG